MALSGTSKGGFLQRKASQIELEVQNSTRINWVTLLMNCKFNSSIELFVCISSRSSQNTCKLKLSKKVKLYLWNLICGCFNNVLSWLCFQYRNYFLRFARIHQKKLTLQIMLPFSKPNVKEHYFCYGKQCLLDFLCLCAPPNIG